MKNKRTMFGITVLAAVIGFAMTSCPNGDDDGGGKTFLGNALELSGQVYMEKYTDTGIINYEKYTGNLNIREYDGGSGSITEGQFNYTIGEPTYLAMFDDLSDMFYEWDNVKSGNPNAKGTMLSDIDIVNSSDYDALNRGNTKAKTSVNSYSGTTESVMYVYVDDNITISGTGKTEPYLNDEDGYIYSDTTTTKNFSLALKKGWNAVYTKTVTKGTFTTAATTATTKYTSTVTMSLGNPNLKWILSEKSYNASVLAPPQRSLSGAPAVGNFRYKAFNRIRRRVGN